MARELTPSALFNGYVGASVVYALDELGVVQALASDDRSTLGGLAEALDVDPVLLRALVRTASGLGYVEVVDGEVRLTVTGERLVPLRGYFTWLVGGYGGVLGELAAIARGRRVFGRDVERDEARVAAGAGTNDRSFMAPLFHDVMDELSFASFADLGCGAGGRLIDLCRRRPDVRGIGIDISREACALAEANVARAGLGDRVRIVCADVLDILGSDPGDGLANVDTVGSFFMLHDLLNGDGASSDLFDRLRRSFPRARRYVLADTMTMPPTDAGALPIFSLGYELVHAFMGVRLYPRAEYERLFERAGLTVARCVPFGTPHSWLYVLEWRA